MTEAIKTRHCARCGKKCNQRVGDYENHKDKVIHECPAGHGVQHIEDQPPVETLPEENAEGDGAFVDDVAEAVDHGPGSHN